MRCLANALLLKPASRQLFVDCGFAPDVANRFAVRQVGQPLELSALIVLEQSTDGAEDDTTFVSARLLFLLTYETALDFVQLVRKHKIADRILGVSCLQSEV